jgi:hypothetical protein
MRCSKVAGRALAGERSDRGGRRRKCHGRRDVLRADGAFCHSFTQLSCPISEGVKT